MWGLLEIVKLRVTGADLINEEIIRNLKELRVVIDKIYPLEVRIKNQVKALIRAADNKDNPDLAHKPNIAAFVDQQDDDRSEDDEDGSVMKTKKYVPPRIDPVYYDDKSRKHDEKRRAKRSDLINELREEFSDKPSEIFDADAFISRRQKRRMQDIKEHEEETFTRLRRTKADKRVQKSGFGTSFSDITKFDFDFKGEEEHDGKKKKHFGKRKRKKILVKRSSYTNGTTHRLQAVITNDPFGLR
ncbi:hypothetical protein ACOME3_007977 [Neoechinorhynchus agilis]